MLGVSSMCKKYLIRTGRMELGGQQISVPLMYSLLFAKHIYLPSVFCESYACRLFEYLQTNELNFPVIHHLKFPAAIDRYFWLNFLWKNQILEWLVLLF